MIVNDVFKIIFSMIAIGTPLFFVMSAILTFSGGYTIGFLEGLMLWLSCGIITVIPLLGYKYLEEETKKRKN